jgi:hypothetical protein
MLREQFFQRSALDVYGADRAWRGVSTIRRQSLRESPTTLAGDLSTFTCALADRPPRSASVHVSSFRQGEKGYQRQVLFDPLRGSSVVVGEQEFSGLQRDVRVAVR